MVREVLQTQTRTPVAFGNGCTVATGEWFSWYDDTTWTLAADVDIDHMVPLSEAWASGASAWTTVQRQQYANDLGVPYALQAVTDNVNQSKGDRDPALWMPSATAATCEYVTDWILVKYRWSLTIDVGEKSAISGYLAGSCGATIVTLPTVMITAVQPVPVPPVPNQPEVAPAGAPVYRFWSDVYHGHFFTISTSERDSVIATYPGIWKYEGAKFNGYTTKQPGTVPLYRFWSDRHGGHFYTNSEAEKREVIAKYDDYTWKYERIAFYVYPLNSTVTNTLPVARFWSDTYGHHFFTASAAESAATQKYPRAIWAYEQNRFRVPATGSAAPPIVKPPVVVPPVVKPPVVVPPTTPANPGDTKNCTDFSTYAAAKAWFDTYYRYYGDVARLDADDDRIPCESLPGAP